MDGAAVGAEGCGVGVGEGRRVRATAETEPTAETAGRLAASEDEKSSPPRLEAMPTARAEDEEKSLSLALPSPDEN